MAEAAAVAAALLALVFAAAAVAKLRGPHLTAGAFAGLGLPAPALLARSVAAPELALAATLVVRPRLGGTLALATLAVFSAVLARAVARGEAVSCGCFGTASTSAVSWVDLVRNVLLAALAGAALAAPRPVAPTVEALVLVTTAGAAGLVVLALCRLRRDVGAVWDNRLAGEAGRVAG